MDTKYNFILEVKYKKNPLNKTIVVVKFRFGGALIPTMQQKINTNPELSNTKLLSPSPVDTNRKMFPQNERVHGLVG